MVLSCHIVTFASKWFNRKANGNPTINEFPITTIFLPTNLGETYWIIRITAFTVHGIKFYWVKPYKNKPN